MWHCLSVENHHPLDDQGFLSAPVQMWPPVLAFFEIRTYVDFLFTLLILFMATNVACAIVDTGVIVLDNVG